MEFQRWNVLCSGCRICLFISTVINNACLTCTDTFLFYICISSWFLLIRWKTTTLPLGDDAAHLCVSVIYGSGFDSERVSHLKPVLKPPSPPNDALVFITHSWWMFSSFKQIRVRNRWTLALRQSYLFPEQRGNEIYLWGKGIKLQI